MIDQELLPEAQQRLSDLLKPYQQQLTRRQRQAAFIQQVLKAADRDDFLELGELLKSPLAREVEAEEDLSATRETFERLRAYADAKVDRYRIDFIEDLTTRAREAGLPLEVDFPRFTVLKGIEGTVDFAARTTTVNRKVLKSIDPRRIIPALLSVKKALYDRPFDAQAFIDGLFQTYSELLKREKQPIGNAVPIQQLYLEHVLSLQSKAFFQDMDKGKFRGYSQDQLAVDLWRYFQAGIGGTSSGHALQLRPGRNNALWLIDSDGERRQISTVAFQGGRR